MSQEDKTKADLKVLDSEAAQEKLEVSSAPAPVVHGDPKGDLENLGSKDIKNDSAATPATADQELSSSNEIESLKNQLAALQSDDKLLKSKNDELKSENDELESEKVGDCSPGPSQERLRPLFDPPNTNT